MIQSQHSTVFHISKLTLGFVLSLTVLFIWMNVELSKPIPLSSTPSQSSNQKISKYIETLSINPFLKTDEDTQAYDSLATLTEIQEPIKPFASLSLKLHGIVFRLDKMSYAMLSMNGAIQEIYAIGDKIKEGLFLENINKKHVDVNYFGERFRLTIKKSLGHNLQITQQAPNTETSNLAEQLERLEVDKKRNPIRLFMIRRPYAVYHEGNFLGYKIMPGSNADQFKRLGFESGDIIKYLNGVEFTGPGMKAFVIQELTHSQHIDLTVTRGNQKLSITYGF